MEYEFKIDDRLAKLEFLERDNDKLVVKVDDKKYELDIVNVGKGNYSVLFAGKSYNIELVEGESPKKYIVNTLYRTFALEVVDAETRYLWNRGNGLHEESANTIVSPMPGKVVKVFVSHGQEVIAGETLIVISAMKMESEYKSKTHGIVKKIFVNEGDTVQGNQPLVTIEPVE